MPATPSFHTTAGPCSGRPCVEVLASGEFEAPEVEAALLKSLDGARYPVDEALFAGIRARALESK